MEHVRRLACALAALTLSAAAAAPDEPKPRLLAVSGEGEVSVAPDRADVGFSVEASEKTLADAERIVTEGTAKLLKLCDTLGIPKHQVRSAQLNVNPQYDGGVVSSRPRIVGYFVSRQVDVDLRDLSKLGKLLQGAVETAANRVSGVGFGSTKKDDHQRAALAAAAEDAKANAEVLAKAMGVKLGRLHGLVASESGGQPMPMMFEMRAKMAVSQAPADQTYQAGEIRFQASVTAEYDLP
ncbi:MAG: SIMPL domain-containing protein [Gammaproteobacteria bacterium]